MRLSHFAQPYLCDEETERELLGCLLVDIDLRRNVKPFLRVDDFYLHEHRVVYHAILCSGEDEFFKLGALFDSHPLIQEVGGEDYIRHLAAMVENYADGFMHAQKIATLGKQRRLLTVAQDLARAAFNGQLHGLHPWINGKIKSALRGAIDFDNSGRQIEMPGMLASSSTTGPMLRIVDPLVAV
jgi:hypothetical protein